MAVGGCNRESCPDSSAVHSYLSLPPKQVAYLTHTLISNQSSSGTAAVRKLMALAVAQINRPPRRPFLLVEIVFLKYRSRAGENRSNTVDRFNKITMRGAWTISPVYLNASP